MRKRGYHRFARMTTRLTANLALLFGVTLAGQANALIIETTTLENAYIEALPTELLSHGGISVVTQPGSVTNPDPIFFGASAEELEEVRTIPGSSLRSVGRRVRLSDIGANVGRVYDLDLESGEIIFSDGEQGATLPDGDPIVATYEVGTGSTGNIKTIFKLGLLDLAPFLIPRIHFSTEPQGKPDFRFVLTGISAIDLFPTELGLLISGIQPTRVSEPTTLGLLGAGLFGLVVLRRKRAA